MVDRQWTRRLRGRDDRRQPDAPLPRIVDRAGRIAARTSADPRQGRRHAGRGYAVLAAVHQPMEEGGHFPGGSCADRKLSSRLLRAGMELRDRRPPDRGAHLDGAERPHDLCRVAPAAGRRRAAGGPAFARHAAGQRSRSPWHDLRRRLRARDSCRRREAPAHRCGALFAGHSGAGGRHRSQARLVPGFRSSDGGRTRPGLDRQSSMHRRGNGSSRCRTMVRNRCEPQRRAAGGSRGRAAPPSRPRPCGRIDRDGQQCGHAAGARLDRPAGGCRRCVRVFPATAERPRRSVDHRGLSVVRGLGPRHHDKPAGPDTRDRTAGDRAPHPQDIRQLRQRGDASQRVPRRRRSARVQHGRCIALVFRSLARLFRYDQRYRRAARGLPGTVGHDRMAPEGNPLRHRGGSRPMVCSGPASPACN